MSIQYTQPLAFNKYIQVGKVEALEPQPDVMLTHSELAVHSGRSWIFQRDFWRHGTWSCGAREAGQGTEMEPQQHRLYASVKRLNKQIARWLKTLNENCRVCQINVLSHPTPPPTSHHRETSHTIGMVKSPMFVPRARLWPWNWSHDLHNHTQGSVPCE